ncbi:MAG: tetratricopeptide repeat protein [Cyanobacteriota bacterium]|nr:tetratricopeptide repeat protein [Cyanobacteriota bacterium]
MFAKILSIASLTVTALTLASPAVRAQDAELEAELDNISLDSACGQIVRNPQGRFAAFTPPTYEPQAIPEELNTARAWQVVGEDAAATGDFHNALQAYNKAIDLSGGQNPELFEQRGWVYYIQDNYDRAITDLKAAARLYQDRENRIARTDACQMISFVEQQQDNNS